MSFTFLFYKHIIFRHSCGACKYTNLKRPSDITIADFWGWENTDKAINQDNKGVSLVLCNTEKGQKLFELVKERMNIIPAKLENCMQPNLVHPSAIHPKRNQFEHDYAENGFKYVFYKYGEEGCRYKVKRIFQRIKRLVKRIMRTK